MFKFVVFIENKIKKKCISRFSKIGAGGNEGPWA